MQMSDKLKKKLRASSHNMRKFLIYSADKAYLALMLAAVLYYFLSIPT